jgi:hypothetical protein
MFLSSAIACLAAAMILAGTAQGSAQSPPTTPPPPAQTQTPPAAEPQTGQPDKPAEKPPRSSKRVPRTSKRQPSAPGQGSLENARPSRDGGPTRQDVTLTANVLGGYDDNLTAGLGSGSGTSPNAMVSGPTASVDGTLGYFRGNYFSIGIEKDLAEAAAAAKGSRLGAVLACNGGVLLKDTDGSLSLPLAPNPSLDSLTAKLTALGLTPQIDFVYAAFDDRTTGGHAVYYHGQVSGTLPQGYRIVPLTDLAQAPLANPAEAQMLTRYAEDFKNGSFSIYHGTETSGQVRQIGV